MMPSINYIIHQKKTINAKARETTKWGFTYIFAKFGFTAILGDHSGRVHTLSRGHICYRS